MASTLRERVKTLRGNLANSALCFDVLKSLKIHLVKRLISLSDAHSLGVVELCMSVMRTHPPLDMLHINCLLLVSEVMSLSKLPSAAASLRQRLIASEFFATTIASMSVHADRTPLVLAACGLLCEHMRLCGTATSAAKALPIAADVLDRHGDDDDVVGVACAFASGCVRLCGGAGRDAGARIAERLAKIAPQRESGALVGTLADLIHEWPNLAHVVMDDPTVLARVNDMITCAEMTVARCATHLVAALISADVSLESLRIGRVPEALDAYLEEARVNHKNDVAFTSPARAALDILDEREAFAERAAAELLAAEDAAPKKRARRPKRRVRRKSSHQQCDNPGSETTPPSSPVTPPAAASPALKSKLARRRRREQQLESLRAELDKVDGDNSMGFEGFEVIVFGIFKELDL